MSLEEDIQALTAAIIANTAALNSEDLASEPAKRGRKPKNPESTQPAATSATPVTMTPVTGPVTQSSAASITPVDSTLLAETTEAVIKLANEYSRDKAVAILAKRKVTRCSDLKQEELRTVFNEALAEIAVEQAAKTVATANASLV